MIYFPLATFVSALRLNLRWFTGCKRLSSHQTLRQDVSIENSKPGWRRIENGRFATAQLVNGEPSLYTAITSEAENTGSARKA